MAKDTLDYGGLFLAGKSNEDISVASKLQGFDVADDLLSEQESYERYGKEKGIDPQVFHSVYEEKLKPEFRKYKGGQFIERDLSTLNLPDVDTPFGLSPKGYGRPYMADAEKGQVSRNLGGVDVEINTPESIADEKDYFIFNGAQVPYDRENIKRAKDADQMLIAKQNDETGQIEWNAVPRTAAVSHQLVRNTFGDGISSIPLKGKSRDMIGNQGVLRGIYNSFIEIPGAIGHLGESAATLGNWLGAKAYGPWALKRNTLEGSADFPVANFFRRLENWSSREKFSSVDDESQDLNAYQVSNFISSIGEMMLVAWATAGASAAVEGGAAATRAAVGGGELMEGAAMRNAFKETMTNPKYAGKVGEWAGLTDMAVKSGGAWKEAARKMGINDDDASAMYAMVVAKNLLIWGQGPNKLVKFWTSGGKKAFTEAIMKPLQDATAEAGGTLTQTAARSALSRGLTAYSEMVGKTRITQGLLETGPEVMLKGEVDQNTTTALQATYDLIAPWAYRAANRKGADELTEGNGLFGSNYSDVVNVDLKSAALGYIGGAFGGFMKKPISHLNKGMNDIISHVAKRGDKAFPELRSGIEEAYKQGYLGAKYMTAPETSETGTPEILTAESDHTKSWANYNRERSMTMIDSLEKIYNEQGGRQIFQLASANDQFAGRLLKAVGDKGGLIHEQLFNGFRIKLINDELAFLKDKTDENSVRRIAELQTELKGREQTLNDLWDGTTSKKFNAMFNDAMALRSSPEYAAAVLIHPGTGEQESEFGRRPKESEKRPEVDFFGQKRGGYEYLREIKKRFDDQINGNEQLGIKPIDARNQEIVDQFNVSRGTLHTTIENLHAKGYDIQNPEIVQLLDNIHSMFPRVGMATEAANRMHDYFQKLEESTPEGIDEETGTINPQQQALHQAATAQKGRFYTSSGLEAEDFEDGKLRPESYGKSRLNQRPELIEKPDSPFDMMLGYDEGSKQFVYLNSAEPLISRLEQRMARAEDFTENDLNQIDDYLGQIAYLRSLAGANFEVWDKYDAKSKAAHDSPLGIPAEQQGSVLNKLTSNMNRLAAVADFAKSQVDGYSSIQKKFSWNQAKITSHVLENTLKHLGLFELQNDLEDVVANMPTLSDHLLDTTKMAEAQRKIYDIIEKVDKDKILGVIDEIVDDYSAKGKDFHRNIYDYLNKDVREVYDFNRFLRNAAKEGLEGTDRDHVISEQQLMLFNALNDIYKFKGKEFSTRLKSVYGNISPKDLGNYSKEGDYPSSEQRYILQQIYQHAKNPSNDLWIKFATSVSNESPTLKKTYFEASLDDANGPIRNMLVVRGVAGSGKTSLVRGVVRTLFESETKSKPKVLVIAPNTALYETHERNLRNHAVTSYVHPKEIEAHDIQNYDLIIYDEISTIGVSDIASLSKKLNEVGPNIPILGLGDEMQVLPRNEQGVAQTSLPIFTKAARTPMLTYRYRTGSDSLWKLSNSIIRAITIGAKTNEVLFPEVVHTEDRSKGVEYFKSNDETVQTFRDKLAEDKRTLLLVKNNDELLEVKSKYNLSDEEMRFVRPIEINKQGTSFMGGEISKAFVYNKVDFADPNYSRYLLTAVTRGVDYVGLAADGRSVVGEDKVLTPGTKEVTDSYKQFKDEISVLSQGSEEPGKAAEKKTASTDSQRSVVDRLKKESEGIVLKGDKYSRAGKDYQRASSYRKGGKTASIKDSDSTRGNHLHKILEHILNGDTDEQVRIQLKSLAPEFNGSADNRKSSVENIDEAIKIFRGLSDTIKQYGIPLSEIRVATDKIQAKGEFAGIAGTLDVPIVMDDGRVKILDLKSLNMGSKMPQEKYEREWTDALNTYKKILEAEGYTVDPEGLIFQLPVELTDGNYTVKSFGEPRLVKLSLNSKDPKPKRKPAWKSDLEKQVTHVQRKSTPLDQSDNLRKAIKGDSVGAIAKGVAKLVASVSDPAYPSKQFSAALPSHGIAIGKGIAKTLGIENDSQLVQKAGASKHAIFQFLNENKGVGLIAEYVDDVRSENSPVFLDQDRVKEWESKVRSWKKKVEKYPDGTHKMPAIVIRLDSNDPAVKSFMARKDVFSGLDPEQITRDGADIVSTLWLPESSADPSREVLNNELTKAFDFIKQKGRYPVTLDDSLKIPPGNIKTGQDASGKPYRTPLRQFISKVESKGLRVSAPYFITETAAERARPQTSGGKVNFYVDISYNNGESVRVKVEPSTLESPESRQWVSDQVSSWKQYDEDFSKAEKGGKKEVLKGAFQTNGFWQILKQNQSILFDVKTGTKKSFDGSTVPYLKMENGDLTFDYSDKSAKTFSERMDAIHNFIEDNGLYEQMKMWERLDPNFPADPEKLGRYQLSPKSIDTMVAWADDVWMPNPFIRINYASEKPAYTEQSGAGTSFADEDLSDFGIPKFLEHVPNERPGFVSEESARKLLETTLNPEFLNGNLEFKPKVVIDGKTGWGVLHNGQIIIKSTDGQVHEEAARHERMHAIIDHFLDEPSKERLYEAAKKEFEVWSNSEADEQLATWAGKRYLGIKGEFNKVVDQFLGWVSDVLSRFNIHKFELNSLLSKAERGYFFDKEPVNTSGTTRFLMSYEEEEDLPIAGKQSWLSLAETFGHANHRDKVFRKVLGMINDSSINSRKLNSPNLSIPEAIQLVREKYKALRGKMDSEFINSAYETVKTEGWSALEPKLGNKKAGEYMASLLADDSVFEALVQKQFPKYKIDSKEFDYETLYDKTEEEQTEDLQERDTAGQALKTVIAESNTINPDERMSEKLVNLLRTVREGKLLSGNISEASDKAPFVNIDNVKNILNGLSAIRNFRTEDQLTSLNTEEFIISHLADKLKNLKGDKNKGMKLTTQSILSTIGGPDAILNGANRKFGTISDRIKNDTLTWWDYARNTDRIKREQPGLSALIDAKADHARKLINTLVSFYDSNTVLQNQHVIAKWFGESYDYKTKTVIATTRQQIRNNLIQQMASSMYTTRGDRTIVNPKLKERFDKDNYDVQFSGNGISIKGEKVLDFTRDGKKIDFSFSKISDSSLRTSLDYIRQILKIGIDQKTIDSFLESEKGKKDLADVYGTLLYATHYAAIRGERSYAVTRLSEIAKERTQLNNDIERYESFNSQYEKKSNISFKSYEGLSLAEKDRFFRTANRIPWSQEAAIAAGDGFVVDYSGKSDKGLHEALTEAKNVNGLKSENLSKNVVAAWNEGAKSITLHRSEIRKGMKLSEEMVDAIDLLYDQGVTFHVTDEVQNREILDYLNAKDAEVKVYHAGEYPFIGKGGRDVPLEMKYGYQPARTEFTDLINDVKKELDNLESEEKDLQQLKKTSSESSNKEMEDIMSALAKANGVKPETLQSIGDEMQEEEVFQEENFYRPTSFYKKIDRLASAQAEALDKDAMYSIFGVKGTRIFNRTPHSAFDNMFGGSKEMAEGGISKELAAPDLDRIDTAIDQIDNQIKINKANGNKDEVLYLQNKKTYFENLKNRQQNPDNAFLNNGLEYQLANNTGIEFEFRGKEIDNLNSNEYATVVFDSAVDQMMRPNWKGELQVTLNTRGDKKKSFVLKNVKFLDSSGNPISWFKSRSNLSMTDEAWRRTVDFADKQFALTRQKQSESLARLNETFGDERFLEVGAKDHAIWSAFNEHIQKLIKSGIDPDKYLAESGLYKNQDYQLIDIADPSFPDKIYIPGNSAFGDIAEAKARFLIFDENIRKGGEQADIDRWTKARSEARKALYRYSAFNHSKYEGLDFEGKKNRLKQQFRFDYDRMVNHLSDNAYKPNSKVTPAEFKREFYNEDKQPIPFYESMMVASHLVNTDMANLADGHPFNFKNILEGLKRSSVAITDGLKPNLDDPRSIGHTFSIINLRDKASSRNLFGKEISKGSAGTDGMIMVSPLFQERLYHGFGGEGGMVTRRGPVKPIVSDVNRQNFDATNIKSGGFPMTAEYLEEEPMLMDMFLNSMSKQLRDQFTAKYEELKGVDPVNAFDSAIAYLNEHINENNLHDHYAAFYAYDSTQKGTSSHTYDYEDFAAKDGYDPSHLGRKVIDSNKLLFILNPSKNVKAVDTASYTQLMTTLGMHSDSPLYNEMVNIEKQVIDEYTKGLIKDIGDDVVGYLRKELGLRAASQTLNDIHFATLVRNENIDINHQSLQTKLMQYFVSAINDKAIKAKRTGSYFIQMPADFLGLHDHEGISHSRKSAERLAMKLSVSVDEVLKNRREYAPMDHQNGETTLGEVALKFPHADKFGIPLDLDPADVISAVDVDAKQVHDLSKLDRPGIFALLKTSLRSDGTSTLQGSFLFDKFLNRERASETYKNDLKELKKLAKKGEQVQPPQGFINTTSEPLYEYQNRLLTWDELKDRVDQINASISDKKARISYNAAKKESKIHEVMPYNHEPVVNEKLPIELSDDRLQNMANEIRTYLDNFEKATTIFLNRNPSNPSSGAFYKIRKFFNRSENVAMVSSKNNLVTDADYDGDALTGYQYAFDKNGRLISNGIKGKQNLQQDQLLQFYLDTAHAKTVLSKVDLDPYEKFADKAMLNNAQFNDIGTNMQLKLMAHTGKNLVSVAATHMASVGLLLRASMTGPIKGLMSISAVNFQGEPVIEKMRDVVQMAVDAINKKMLPGRLGINSNNLSMVTAMIASGKYTDTEIFDTLHLPEVKRLFERVEYKSGQSAFEATLSSLNEERKIAQENVEKAFRVLENGKYRPMEEDEVDTHIDEIVAKRDALRANLQETGRPLTGQDEIEMDQYDKALKAYDQQVWLGENGLFNRLESMIYNGEAINRIGRLLTLRNDIPTQADQRAKFIQDAEQLLNCKLSDFVEAWENMEKPAENYNWKEIFNRTILDEEKRNDILTHEEKLRDHLDARSVVYNLGDFVSRLKLLNIVDGIEKKTFTSESHDALNTYDSIDELQHSNLTADKTRYFASRKGWRDNAISLYYSEMASQPEFYNFLEPFKKYVREIKGETWADGEFDMTHIANRNKFVTYFAQMVDWMKNEGAGILSEDFRTNQWLAGVTVKPSQGTHFVRYDESDQASPDQKSVMIDEFSRLKSEGYHSTWDSETGVHFGTTFRSMVKMYNDLVYGEAFKRGHLVEIMDSEVHEPYSRWYSTFRSRLTVEDSTFKSEGNDISKSEVFGEKLASQIILKDGRTSPFVQRMRIKLEMTEAPRFVRFREEGVPEQIYEASWNKNTGKMEATPKRLKYPNYSNPYSSAEPLSALVTSDRVFNRIDDEQFSNLISNKRAQIIQKGYKQGQTVWIRGVRAKVDNVIGDRVIVSKYSYEGDRQFLLVPTSKKLYKAFTEKGIVDVTSTLRSAEERTWFEEQASQVQEMYYELAKEGVEPTEAEREYLTRSWNNVTVEELSSVGKKGVQEKIIEDFRKERENCK